jgi:hypothetical protein
VKRAIRYDSESAAEDDATLMELVLDKALAHEEMYQQRQCEKRRHNETGHDKVNLRRA